MANLERSTILLFYMKRMIRYVLVLFILFSTFLDLRGQTNDALLNSLSRQCQDHIGQSEFIECNKKYLELVVALNDTTAKINSYKMAITHFYLKKEEASLKEKTEELSLLCKSEYKRKGLQYGCYNKLVNYYINNYKLSEAVNLTDSLLRIAISEENQLGIVVAEKLNADIYYEVGSYDKAINYYKLCIKRWPKDANYILSYREANLHLAISLMRNGLVGEALEVCSLLYDKLNLSVPFVSLSAIDKIYAESITAIRLYCYVKLKVTKEIQDYYNRLSFIANITKSSLEISSEAKMVYFESKGNYKQAMLISNQLMDEMKEHSHYWGILNLYKEIGNIYFAMRMEERAAQSFNAYLKGRDSLLASEDYKYLERINVQQDIQMLKMDNEKKTELLIERTLQLFFFLLITALIALFTIYFFYKKLYKKNHSLRIAKEKTHQALELARLSTKSRSDFIHHISHEIRTPLNSIVGFSDLLREKFEKDKDEETIEFIHLIMKNSDKLTIAVDDILNISTIESLVVEEKESEYQPAKEVKKVVIDVRNTLHQTIEDFDGNIPDIPVFCHFEEESQFIHRKKALNNATRNILRALINMRVKGSLRIDLYMELRQYIVKVTDYGDFLTEDQQQKIFELFYKVDEYKLGIGTAIYIAHSIADTLSGSLVLDKKYNEGIRLNLTIPLTIDSSENTVLIHR